MVSPGFLAERSMDVSNEKLDELSLQGKTIVFVVFEGKVIGAVALADVIREESKKAIKKLKEMGIRCIMITGDKKEVAEWVSKEIGLDKYYAEVLPHAELGPHLEITFLFY